MISQQRILIVLSCIALFCTGCPSKAPPAGTTGGGKTGKQDPADQRCADNLDNAFSSLDPYRLEIDADIEATATVLNSWLSTCGTSEWENPELLKKLDRLLSDQQMTDLQGERFGSRDVTHIRTAILLRRIAEQASANADSDLERATRLFEYVARNVVPQPDNQNIPLTLYQVVLFGRATAEHQAWLFAELLHQLRIDAVILTPQEETSSWVTAVCLDDGNYLFDFSLLTPVPRDAEKSWPISTPATLKEVIQKPEILASLRALGSQVPTAESLKNPAVWIPSETTFWSMRMRSLNQTQTGSATLLADALLDGDYGQGILSRVDDASERWKRDDIRIWDFPEDQLSRYWSISPNSSQSQALRARIMPFHAPLEVEVNKEKQDIKITEKGNKQWMARLSQLEGDFTKAIMTFGGLRIGSKSTRNLMAAQDVDAQFQIILQREDVAAEDAHFWVAISQLESGEITNAKTTLRDYLNRYESARWTDAVRYLLARIHLMNDDYSLAAEQLDQILQTSSLKNAAAFLKSRFPESSNTSEPNTDEKQESSADGTDEGNS
ncbi:MAG: transglutaminase domain-containing protein [Planctomycetaceae bacterium]|nr:transglutaminase domain-containing protein [Planctomycetaceae bacterium]